MSIAGLLELILSLLLNALVIYFVLRAPRPWYVRVVLFCSVQILIASTDAIVAFAAKALYLKIFWAGDLTGHLFILLLIVGLIQRTRKTPRATWALTVCAVVVALVSAYLFYSPHLNRWMTPLSRNMSFLEEALDFVLWAAILQMGANDYLLLMVGAGIGVQVTGEVIGHTLRLYSQNRSALWIPNLLVYLSEVFCLAIWIWAFHSVRSPAKRLPDGLEIAADGRDR